MSKKDNIVLFELNVDYNLNYTLGVNGMVDYDDTLQKIVIPEFTIYPDYNIKTISLLANYDVATDIAFLNATNKIRTTVDKSKEVSFQIITNKLKISKQFEIGKNIKDFKFSIKSEEMSNFINYVDSRKIKIFINGDEAKPKDEIEYLKRIFPQINIELKLK